MAKGNINLANRLNDFKDRIPNFEKFNEIFNELDVNRKTDIINILENLPNRRYVGKITDEIMQYCRTADETEDGFFTVDIKLDIVIEREILLQKLNSKGIAEIDCNQLRQYINYLENKEAFKVINNLSKSLDNSQLSNKVFSTIEKLKKNIEMVHINRLNNFKDRIPNFEIFRKFFSKLDEPTQEKIIYILENLHNNKSASEITDKIMQYCRIVNECDDDFFTFLNIKHYIDFDIEILLNKLISRGIEKTDCYQLRYYMKCLNNKEANRVIENLNKNLNNKRLSNIVSSTIKELEKNIIKRLNNFKNRIPNFEEFKEIFNGLDVKRKSNIINILECLCGRGYVSKIADEIMQNCRKADKDGSFTIDPNLDIVIDREVLLNEIFFKGVINKKYSNLLIKYMNALVLTNKGLNKAIKKLNEDLYNDKLRYTIFSIIQKSQKSVIITLLNNFKDDIPDFEKVKDIVDKLNISTKERLIEILIQPLKQRYFKNFVTELIKLYEESNMERFYIVIDREILLQRLRDREDFTHDERKRFSQVINTLSNESAKLFIEDIKSILSSRTQKEVILERINDGENKIEEEKDNFCRELKKKADITVSDTKQIRKVIDGLPYDEWDKSCNALRENALNGKSRREIPSLINVKETNNSNNPLQKVDQANKSKMPHKKKIAQMISKRSKEDIL